MQSWQNKTSFPEKMKRRKKEGHKQRNPSRNQKIMMEQNQFPEKRKKSEEGKQAPEPELEPEGTRKS